MTRLRTRKEEVGVSLFPFLAVLICTMGALIVLLVMVVQLARVDASEPAEGSDRADAAKIEEEDSEWRRELLEAQRQQLRGDAERNRGILGHLEQHIRELEQRAEQLQAEADELARRRRGEEPSDLVSDSQLEQLQQKLELTRRELADAQRRAAQRRPSYAIVPYHGPRGTHRRPIYLECTDQGVTIQPEGVRLTEEDFDGPLGTGNPLDAALRVIRHYWARTSTASAAGAPYPLLLVRPGGVTTYAAARAAMREWDDEFGYELIADDLSVHYSDKDPQLASLLQKAVADARSRQKILSAAMPGRRGNGQQGFVAASGGGGFVPNTPGRVPSEREPSGWGGFGRGGDPRQSTGQSPSGRDGANSPARESQRRAGDGTASQRTSTGKGQVGADSASKPGQSSGDALVGQRGENWGLPDRGRAGTGVVRPIRLACLTDRLIVLPEKGEGRVPEVILVTGSIMDEVDQLVESIWKLIDGWGIAVAGGYWKPVLHVTVGQGADQRFVELETLLQGSGLSVQRTNR